MINFDDYANENKTQHNQKQRNIPDHPYRILIIGGSATEKTNQLLNLINSQPVFIEYSNAIQDVYKIIDEYNTD